MADAPTSLNRRQILAAGAAGAALAGTFGFDRRAAADESDEMITQIAKFKINMDKEDEAVELIQGLCQAVEENEPGVLVYMAFRDQKNPEDLVFFEVYKDADTLAAHGQTPHLGELRTKFLTHFKPPLEVVRLDPIGVFHRE